MTSNRTAEYALAFAIVFAAAGGVWYHAQKSGEALPRLAAVVTPTASIFSAPPAASGVSVLFAGDLMLDRAVAAHAQEYDADALYKNVLPLFENADLRVVNLEGTITDNPSVATENNLHFTFSSALAREVLQGLNISAVTLANNHSGDFGADGFSQTKTNLMQDGVASFGAWNNTDLSVQAATNGKNLCFIGYEEFVSADAQPIADEIGRLKPDCWRIVVFAHWGIEYAAEPTPRQRELAHQFIDAGADLVVGAHPHVVEPVEIYKNKAVFYSLGNFIFDQDFSWATEHGLAVKADFSDTGDRYELTPLSTIHAEASPAAGDDRARVLAAAVDAETPAEVAASITETGSFTLAPQAPPAAAR